MMQAKCLEEHVKEMKNIQSTFEDFFESSLENYDKLVEKLQDRQQIVSFLRFISISTNHHHRHPTLFNNITSLLLKLEGLIHEHLTNIELFKIFKKNKLLLLYLFDKKIITPDETITKIISFQKYQDKSYPQFFWPEFKSFFSKELNDKIEAEFNKKAIDEDIFKQCRKIGQNDHYICQLIRDDSIEDFISHVNQESPPLTSEIESSIFETNPLFITKRPTLIQYALFFGSVQILKYLMNHEVSLTETDWIYGIHSNNSEIIEIFESNEIKPQISEIKNNVLKEAIKCHHNEVAQYIIDNYIDDFHKLSEIYLKSIKYYNYIFFPDDAFKLDLFSLIELKNATLCEIYVKENDVDINKTIKGKIEVDDFESGKYQIFKDVNKTALIKSIEVNNCDFVEYLVTRKDLNLNIDCSDQEVNPLFYAIQKQNPEIVQLFLTVKDAKLDIKSINKFKKRFLKYYENARMEGAAEAEGKRTRTPLWYALEKNNTDIAKLFLERKNLDVNCECVCDYEEHFSYIETTIYNFTKSLLFSAIENENVEVARLLLSYPNIDVNFVSSYKSYRRNRAINSFKYNESYEKTALFLAVEKENFEIVKLLLSNENVDVNCLCSFEYYKDRQIKEIQTPLCMAVSKQNMPIIDLLLSNNKTNVNHLANYNDKYGRHPSYSLHSRIDTALSIAIENENIEIVKRLLQTNINIDMKLEKDGKLINADVDRIIFSKKVETTCLLNAIQKGNLEIFNLLLPLTNEIQLNQKYSYDYKEDIRTKKVKITKNETNALSACFKCILDHKRVDILKLLLERKDLDINVKIIETDEECSTYTNMLEKLVIADKVESIKLLLERDDIDVNMLLFEKKGDEIQNKHTVLHTAIQKNNKDIIQLLINKNAIDIPVTEPTKSENK